MSDETNMPLVGQLIEAGHFKDSCDLDLHGVLITCSKDVLQNARIPLYSDVFVLHSWTTAREILDFMYTGIPMNTLKEVHAGLEKMINKDSR